MSSIQLFPHLLTRIGGLPWETLHHLRLPEKIWKKSLQLADYQLVTNTPPPHFAQLLAEFKIDFERSIPSLQTNLQELSRSAVFQKGLVLSSTSLTERIWSYQKKTPFNFRKKERQTERTVAQYLARIVTKTTPFSSFTPVLRGTILPQSDLFKLELKKEYKLKVNINNYFQKLLHDIQKNDSTIYSKLPVFLNPTIVEYEENYTFLFNINNYETFQIVEKQPVIAYLKGILDDQSSLKTVENLVAILQEVTEIEQVVAAAFIKQLLDVGFLELHLATNPQTFNWTQQLMTQPLENQSDNTLLHFLSNLQLQAALFGKADAQGRFDLLSDSYNSTLAFLEEKKEKILQKEEQKKEEHIKDFFFHDLLFSKEQLFYEDVLQEGHLNLPENDVTDLICILHQFLTTLPLLLGEERLRAIHFFDQTYGSHATVPFLRFYEDYYRFLNKKKEGKLEDIPQILKEKEEISKWIFQVKQYLLEQGKNEILNLQIADFQSIKSKLNFNTRSLNHGSLACFCQFFRNKKEEKKEINAVLNNLGLGYGKLASRFLDLLPPAVYKDFLDFNQKAFPSDFLLAERSDASYFNANLHPPLMQFEVATTGKCGNLPKEKCFSLVDLEVKKTAQGLLTLDHSQRKQPILTFDLGLQTPKGRSESFRFLEIFNPPAPTLFYLKTAVEAAFGTSFMPRLTLENRWVVGRRSWKITQPESWIRRGNQADYLLEIQRLRLEWGLPEQVFYSFQTATTEVRKVEEDTHKPQFLDFKNPFLVDIFERTVKKLERSFLFVEVFPNDGQLFDFQGAHFATETLLHWYF